MMQSICNGWEFTPQWSQSFGLGQGDGIAVRLPHNAADLPNHYGDHNAYQMICGYRKKLPIPENYAGKRVFLQFDGAGHIATVYVNGQKAGHHRTGYTGFRVEITDFVTPGQEAIIAVELDTTENPATPPFGFVIDYLTYGGLYREVWLDVREQKYIEDVFVTTPTATDVHVELKTHGADVCQLSILEEDGTCLLTKKTTSPANLHFPEAKLWSNVDPHRYILKCELLDDEGNVQDTQEVKFGVRTFEFKNDGFYLNGKKTFLRGLNRHQCYPHMGYAAPESLQREDARILKEELGCIAVRTSHYPQSQYFIDECDRLGLLVFTEIPGWQHIGDDAWKKQAVENTKEMVLQYRNHPSIVLWGVRINESGDCDEMYEHTNAVAHELDPSRPTSGVRCILKSSLLEDVYAYNDFSHIGFNPGVRLKKKVTPDMNKPLLVSEHNGHMFPTKSFDTWSKRQEHALRHATVQSAAAASGEHCGCFGWCMFDYPTHKDFGSGDRVCYHGVLDFYRNPKIAADVYASQQEKKPVLSLSSPMDIGDYPGGQLGTVYAFSNAEKVLLYKNDLFVTELKKGHWKGLPHSPFVMDDIVGQLLETQEGYDQKKSNSVRKALLTIAEKGLEYLSPIDKLQLGIMALRYKIDFKTAWDLYGKYIGNWGGTATVWRLDAVTNGKVVASKVYCPTTDLHLDVSVSATTLQEKASYDTAAIRIRVLDANGNIAPYAQIPVLLKLEGEAELIGPSAVTAEGGMCGTFVRTTGRSGEATLTISTAQTPEVSIKFNIL